VGLCGADLSGQTIRGVGENTCPNCLLEARRRYSRVGVHYPGSPGLALDRKTGEVICWETGQICKDRVEVGDVLLRIMFRGQPPPD
jgi:hypothetical protein